MEERTTPDWIESLGEFEVFVFGSNLSGRHGAGAARTALKWGAKWGQAAGMQGKTYAIPSVNADITRSLSPEEIKPWVDDFTGFAKSFPGLKFLVTEIGCGLAGLKPEDVAPLFKEASELSNVYLPKRFWHNLK